MTYREAVGTTVINTPDDPDGFIAGQVTELPELFHRRAPGITCLSALRRRKEQRESGETIGSFIGSKINNSKGCGGVMRAAPVGMMRWERDVEKIAFEGAECAAVTHCHSLGYMPAAVLAQIVYQIIYDERKRSLKEIAIDARDTAERLFRDDPHLDELTACIDLAIALSENSDSDLDNIHRLGEGWVAEEALAIALYCSLKYENDFSRGIIASVNHKGDSDSTGAIAGNILGAVVGYEAIEQKWKENLELADAITKIADMLCERSITQERG